MDTSSELNLPSPSAPGGRGRSLQRELLVGQLLPLALVLSGLVAFAWFGWTRLALAHSEVRVQAELEGLQRTLNQRFGEIERLAESLAGQWRGGVLDPAQDAACWKHLQPQVEPYPLLTALNLVTVDGTAFGLGRLPGGWGGKGIRRVGDSWISGPIHGDPQGRVRMDPQGSRRAMDFRMRPWFEMGSAASRGFWTDPSPFMGSWSGEMGIYFVMPVRDDRGSLLGVFSMSLRLESLTEELGRLRPTAGAVLLALDAQGRLVIPPLSGPFQDPDARRKAFLTPVSEHRVPLAHQLWQQHQAGRSNKETLAGHAAGFHGRLLFFQRPGLTWAMVLVLPDAEVLGAAHRRGLIILGCVVVAVLGLGWQVLRWAQRVSRPLHALAEAAEGLGVGQVPSPPASRILEIQALGHALVEAHGTLKERELLQEQLRQSQKLETVGTLAGGIAHDINNQLTAILGQLELGEERMDPAHPSREHLRRAAEAAHRCGDTTRALLTFSRPAPMEKVCVDLEDLVQETLSLVRKLLGPSISIETAFVPGLPPIMGDRAQLEHVLVNLILNARDAMPQGGTLHLFTGWTGTEVRVGVRDEGHGMSPAVQARMFEPFFTTKPLGQGTGLGLPTVLGIVRAHEGVITVDSQEGRGTTLLLAFPPGNMGSMQEVGPREGQDGPSRLVGKRVLVAEDEPVIRATMVEALTRRGALVVEAVDGGMAWNAWNEESFDAVVSDQLMPRLVGTELLMRIRQSGSGVPFVLVSGKGLEDLDPGMQADSRLRLVPKPFSLPKLLQVLEEALG